MNPWELLLDLLGWLLIGVVVLVAVVVVWAVVVSLVKTARGRKTRTIYRSRDK